MRRLMTIAKATTPNKGFNSQVQTEELIADIRAVLTPSQRVEEKLAACSGFSQTLSRRSDDHHAPRRPR